jgi:uncharacterized membrane protein YbhN (UPF0104 family)
MNPSPPLYQRLKHWAKPALTVILLVVIPILLYTQLRNTDWQEVGSSLRDYPIWVLALGALIALASYLNYSCYDLLGRYARCCRWCSSATPSTSI